MIRSISAGNAGLTCVGGIGSRFRIASKRTAVVGPSKGNRPVAIS